MDNIRCTNIHIIRVPEGEERQKVAENIIEGITAENFLNLGRETDIQVQAAQRVPKRIDPKRTTLRHTAIKMAKIKDKETIKSNKEKAMSYIQKNFHKAIS